MTIPSPTAPLPSPPAASPALLGRAQTHTPLLIADNLWKLFGKSGENSLRRVGADISEEKFAELGLIGAVCNVNLSIRRGEIFIVMGLSGSGKSTLLRCLSRLIEPTAGRILYGGQDLLALSQRALMELRRNKMGMVFQHFALLPHLTVLENVAFPLAIKGIDRQTRMTRARDMVALVGLENRKDAYPRQLSGGQQQRVGIARSLAGEPEIWFLDEPFSALDPLIRREMQDELLRLQATLHKTIVFVTHDFEEAIRLADRVAIMKNGYVIQVGSPEDLVSHPANDYVAAFTRHVPRGKVLSVRSLMVPAIKTAGFYDRMIDSKTKAGVIAADVLKSEIPFGVQDSDGQLIGEIGKDQVIAMLMAEGSRE